MIGNSDVLAIPILA